MVSSIIFWGSSTPPRSVTYTDSLYLTVSAMTLAGLNTVNLSQLNTFQQIILFLLIMLGSAILVSSAVVHVRRKAFERRFKNIVEEARAKRRSRSRRNSGLTSPFPFGFSRKRSSSAVRPEVDGVVVRGRAIEDKGDAAEEVVDTRGSDRPLSGENMPTIDTVAAREDARDDLEANHLKPSGAHEEEDGGVSRVSASSQRIKFAQPNTPGTPFSPLTQRPHRRLLSMSGVGARPDIMNHPKKARSPAYQIPLAALTQEKETELHGTHRYFKSGGFIGRNSQFHSLTFAERERLGGVEYRAVTLLEVIVPLYFVLWQLLGCLGLGAWVAYNAADATLQNGLNPWYSTSRSFRGGN